MFNRIKKINFKYFIILILVVNGMLRIKEEFYLFFKMVFYMKLFDYLLF